MTAHIIENDVEDINQAVAIDRNAFDEGPLPKKCLCWVDKIHDLTIPTDGPYHVQTLHESIGVVGEIIPRNFLLFMFVWKIGYVLTCGNTVVLKTVEQAVLFALYALKLLFACFKGILNVISSFSPRAGAALCSHMDVDKEGYKSRNCRQKSKGVWVWRPKGSTSSPKGPKTTWVMFLTHKHETFINFDIFCRKVQREARHFITYVHSNHGGEFENKAFEEYCAQNGFSRNFSSPRSHYQNGVVE
ncbi:hypothetical protein FXO37_14369 [Capsicum annuum]|nr:hypothetical protein FXO37_14369 [Capsicum annuum]